MALTIIAKKPYNTNKKSKNMKKTKFEGGFLW